MRLHRQPGPTRLLRCRSGTVVQSQTGQPEGMVVQVSGQLDSSRPGGTLATAGQVGLDEGSCGTGFIGDSRCLDHRIFSLSLWCDWGATPIREPPAGRPTTVPVRGLGKDGVASASASVLGQSGLGFVVVGRPVCPARRVATMLVAAGGGGCWADCIVCDAYSGEGPTCSISDTRTTHASTQWDTVLLYRVTADRQLLSGADRGRQGHAVGCGPLSAIRVGCPLGHGHLSDPRCSRFGVIFRAILVHMFSPIVGHPFSPKLVHRFSPKVVHSFSPKLVQGDNGETPSSRAYFPFWNEQDQEGVCQARGRRPWIFERC